LPFQAFEAQWEEGYFTFLQGVRELQEIEIFKNGKNFLFTAILL
jgi:hypothetical protein